MVPFSHMEDRMAELKEMLLNRFSSIESALKNAEESVTREAQQAEQIKESLKAEVSRLETLLREKEDLLSARESAMKELEESLTAKVYQLENQLRERAQLLERRDAELKEMRVFLSRIREKESALSQAEALAERIKESLKVEVSRLEAQLGESGGSFPAQGSESEENATAKVHELEDRIMREGILEGSGAEPKGSSY